jgi:hypothetical protein
MIICPKSSLLVCFDDVSPFTSITSSIWCVTETEVITFLYFSHLFHRRKFGTVSAILKFLKNMRVNSLVRVLGQIMKKVIVCNMLVYDCIMLMRSSVYLGARAASICSSYTDEIDGPYWTEIASCNPCIAEAGCGYCLSTLSCVEGDDLGPFVGPCPDWVTTNTVATCPGKSAYS